MAHRFLATEAFEHDYDSAFAYISYDLGSPRAAARMMDAMDASIEKLRDSPPLNAVLTNPTLEALDYREELVGGYVMLYKVEGGDMVAKRLFHTSQDYESCA